MVTINRYCLAAKKPDKQPLARLLIAGILLVACLPLHAATLFSQVDRQELSSDETLTLTVSLNKQVLFSGPDFNSLEKEFQIINQNRQSGFSKRNGKSESYTRWILTLSPKTTGRLIIPSFSFKGEVSDALEIKVTKPTISKSSDAQIFVEAHLAKPSVYVQEQALLTLQLFTAVHLTNFEMTPLSITDTQVIKLTENQYQKQINGKDYIVVETQFAIFADASGELTIPAVRYTGIAQIKYNRKRISLETEEQTLSVKPRPQEALGTTWLPAQAVRLSDNWSKDKPTMTVGEPVTRTVTLSARGLTAAQLPPLGIDQDKGFKVYNDQAQLENNTSAQGMIGHRIESMAIVPGQPGPLTLPEIRVQWWDTINDRIETAVLPSETFQVLASTNAPVARTSEASTTEPGTETPLSTEAPKDSKTMIRILIAANVLLSLLSLVFAILWWRGRMGAGQDEAAINAASSPHKATLSTVQLAAANDDYAALREAIIQWARDYWQESSIHTLDHISSKADDETLKDLFQQLDTRLYDKQGNNTDTPDIKALIKNLEDLNKVPASPKKTSVKELRPLYPE